jgi:hypothetical protein
VADCILAGPTDKSFSHGIEKNDSPFSVSADDGIANAGQRDVEPLALFLDNASIFLCYAPSSRFFDESPGALFGILPFGQIPRDFREAA